MRKLSILKLICVIYSGSAIAGGTISFKIFSDHYRVNEQDIPDLASAVDTALLSPVDQLNVEACALMPAERGFNAIDALRKRFGGKITFKVAESGCPQLPTSEKEVAPESSYPQKGHLR
jgi:hypothetical protein